MSYRLLVFDWDGTLVDSAGRIVSCMRAAAREAGLPLLPEAELREVIGLGLPQALARLFPGAEAVRLERFVAAYRRHYLEGAHQVVRPFPDAGELLAALEARGYWLAVATGKSRAGLERSLDEHGWRRHFLASRCADETASKPHPQMLLELMEELQVAPEETLMIGDTEYDVLMARAAGADALGVAHGVHGRERLLAQGALACVPGLRGVLAWLEQRPGAAPAAGEEAHG
ncbi:MAG: HAD family hydrolase [Gammaproteobacteria bacterium]|nr:MAG: HAD family hydrolase [Gammaproteobacteria bacterium]